MTVTRASERPKKLSRENVRRAAAKFGPQAKGRWFESLQERRENFILQGQLFVLNLISVSGSTPVLPQWNVKDPGQSAKSAGGRLQLNTHVPYVCGFA